MTNYESERARLQAQLDNVNAAEERDRSNQRDPNAFSLSFHPGDSIVEISAKLNRLMEHLGLHPDSPTVPPQDASLANRSMIDSEQVRDERSSARAGGAPTAYDDHSAAGKQHYDAQRAAVEQTRVNTGQPPPPRPLGSNHGPTPPATGYGAFGPNP